MTGGCSPKTGVHPKELVYLTFSVTCVHIVAKSAYERRHVRPSVHLPARIKAAPTERTSRDLIVMTFVKIVT